MKAMKRISSSNSVSTISSYKSTTSNTSTSSSFSSKSLRGSVNTMKRIKGSLSKKLKKGQRFASSMMVSKRRSRRDMSVIDEDSVINDEDFTVDDTTMDYITLPITLDLDDGNEEFSLKSNLFSISSDSHIPEDHNENEDSLLPENTRNDDLLNVTVRNTEKLDGLSNDEHSDLTPRTTNKFIINLETPPPLLGTESNDEIEEEQMVIEFTPPSQSRRNSFRFDDDTISLTSFQTVRTVERLIHNPTTGLIFLLLLQIETKKFEIIQVHLNNSTIADILNQIVFKATDIILAQQRYRGICRPSNGIEMINLSASAIDEDGECRIVPGEVLVPIPEQHSGMECMRASQCVLSLKDVDNLFQRLNPLSPLELSCDDSIESNEGLSPSKNGSDVFSPVGIELKYSEDHSTEGSSELEGKDISDSKDMSETYEKKESHDDNIVEVVIPEEKLPTIDDLMKFPVRTLRIYEQYLIRILQKQLIMSSQHDARNCARFIVKGSKFSMIFLTVRRIILGTRSNANANIDSLGIVGFVEFALFLSFLIWYQKKSKVQIVGRLVEPRKIELWG